MGDYGTYCGTALVSYLAQVKYDQTSFKDISEASFNNFIANNLIPAAEKFIDTFCNHAFGTPSYDTFSLDGNGRYFLSLPPERCPMIGIGAGSVGATAITVSELKISDTFIQWDGGHFTTGKKNVVLYGSYGYLDKDRVPVVPSDVAYVCAQLCANTINDMVRRRLLPDAYLAMMAKPEISDMKFRSLFNAPSIFPVPMQETLENYRIIWEDMG